jgi:hypothetical protein
MREFVNSSPTITTTWAGMHGEGMQLELSYEIAGEKHYFASFVADPVDESLSLELVAHGRSVQILVTQLESLIAAAKKDVHSEGWYDKPTPSGNGG